MADYKAQEDAERAFYIINFCHLARDYPQTSSLAASFLRELAAMNARQTERDLADAKKPAAEENETHPKSARGR